MSDKPRFEDLGDGTAKDNETGLIWSRKDSFQIVQDWFNFDEAMAFIDDCNRKDFLGFHDWRIPEADEALKIYCPESCIKGRSNVDLYLPSVMEPGGGTGSWGLPFDQQAAFYISYQTGNSQHFDKDYSQGVVRPVRLWGDEG